MHTGAWVLCYKRNIPGLKGSELSFSTPCPRESPICLSLCTATHEPNIHRQRQPPLRIMDLVLKSARGWYNPLSGMPKYNRGTQTDDVDLGTRLVLSIVRYAKV